VKTLWAMIMGEDVEGLEDIVPGVVGGEAVGAFVNGGDVFGVEEPEVGEEVVGAEREVVGAFVSGGVSFG